MSQRVAVLGGGLAGLACAYELAKAGAEVTVLEREPQLGGMACSFIDTSDGEYWSYDFGPHRFHTQDEQLIAHVREILAGNHQQAQRLSRIVLFDRFFDYPLQTGNVLRNLPPLVLVRAFLDYFSVRFTERTGLTHHSDDNFEGWVVKRFGRTLYDLFFGRYTGKTWKMAPDQISGDWASQRISQLSLGDAVRKTLFRPRNAPRGLVTNFIYPREDTAANLQPWVRRSTPALRLPAFIATPTKCSPLTMAARIRGMSRRISSSRRSRSRCSHERSGRPLPTTWGMRSRTYSTSRSCSCT
jgi:protoporphyrinogen oxidase